MNAKAKYVYVLDMNGNPLMPTKRFGKVRHMLKDGLAKVVRRDIFTIQLLYEPKTHVVDELTLGCDTGYTHIGLSASSSRKEYFAEEVIIDNSMVENLKTRAQNRRNRRTRKRRYRKPRFNNRKSSKPKGWLPPSVEHRCETHEKKIDSACKILPIKNIRTELASFDIQKLEDPSIEGIMYQEGETLGYVNKRMFVLARDHCTCQLCKGESKDSKLEVHHIIYKSNGGSDNVNNLITLCSKCHKKIHDKNIILKDVKFNSYREAAGVQSMRNALMERLYAKYPDKNISVCYGYETKYNRKQHGIEKTHHNDAFAIAMNFEAERLGYHYVSRQRRRHDRMLHTQLPASKRGKIDEKTGKRIPRKAPKNKPKPMYSEKTHKRMWRRSLHAAKKIGGSKFRMGDYVRYKSTYGFIYGSSNGKPLLKDINMVNSVLEGHKGNKITTNKLSLIRHQQGQFLVDIVKD